MGRTSLPFLVLLLSGASLLVSGQLGFRGIPGDYCLNHNPQCCPNREDECTVPIMDTLCYCDIFCDRDPPDAGDCCPDFWAVCEGVTPAPPTPRPPTPSPPFNVTGQCDYHGAGYRTGEVVKQNCKSCTCGANGWQCDETVACMIQEDLLEKVQRNGYSWQASNHSDFWGKTLEDGVKYRLGTLYPERSVENMNEILIEPLSSLPATFDAREKWPNYIHPVRDQKDCGASWAFSTTALSADRLAIQSEGKLNSDLSPQQLLSCNQHRQGGCDGGYLDRAWWYIRKLGVLSDDCYPYVSGTTGALEPCLTPKDSYQKKIVKCPSGLNGGEQEKIYRMTPPYRIAPDEEEIKTEIYINGPVQATFLVHEDFYMYKSGVYRHLDLASQKGQQYTKSGYHSVRILGWGEENGAKYWLAANSWGPEWGDNGYFKIARGDNECQVESFVLGAWGRGSKRRRRFRIRKVKRLLQH